MVARTKLVCLGGVERSMEYVVAPRTTQGRPGGVGRSMEVVVAPRTKEVLGGAGSY